jgi:hypothetical protein
MSWKTFKERIYTKFDKKMSVWENKGYHFTNRLHRYAINGLFLYMGYLIYDFLSSYNDLLLRTRSTNKYDELDIEGPINKGD